MDFQKEKDKIKTELIYIMWYIHVPRWRALMPPWREPSLKSPGEESTDTSSRPSYPLLCTASKKHISKTHVHLKKCYTTTYNELLKFNDYICIFKSHLALQLSNSFSKLSLCSLWELRVETLGEALPASLLVLTLKVDKIICQNI